MRRRNTVRTCLAGSSALLMLIAISSAARADIQSDLNARWRGAWLIVTGDISSNCNGLTTDNRINGDLVSGKGRFAFEPGELARVKKVDAKRSRVDVSLELKEGVLIEYQDGPFTLYREASCQAELEIDFGNSRTKDLGIAAVEAQFGEWFERYARLDEATGSPSYNHRVRDAYPEDYASTLAAYEQWKIDQHNQLVASRIADSSEKTALLLAQVHADSEFGAGLSEGIPAMRDAMNDNCDALLKSSPATFAKSAEAPNESWGDGYKIGQQLAYHVELGRRLGRCFIGGGEVVSRLD
jgi:hypothetical protein